MACGVMILSPFQYGVDFGLIGGLQAMVGFLEVIRIALPDPHSKKNKPPVVLMRHLSVL